MQGGHDEGEGDSANGAEEDDVVVSLHGCIIACGAPAVNPYQPKIFSMAMQERMVTG